MKALLGARDQLVRKKRALGNQLRGLLRPFGIRLPARQGTKKFDAAAHEAVRHDVVLSASVTPLLEALAAVEGQIARLDERLKELARRSQVCWRLLSVPGMGPIVALAFMWRSRMSGGSGGCARSEGVSGVRRGQANWLTVPLTLYAERSSPKAALRRAAGAAGLDGEGASHAIIAVAVSGALSAAFALYTWMSSRNSAGDAAVLGFRAAEINKAEPAA